MRSPILESVPSIALAGAVVNHSGAWAAEPYPVMVASGVRPRADRARLTVS